MFDSITGLVKVPAVVPAAWTTMLNMFNNCKDLNDPNLALWNVSKITRMDGMFKGCTALTQDLSGWCVSNITVEPSGFATDSGLTLKPVWGTCPNG